MRTWRATTTAPAEVAWRLLAEPEQWARWAPHLRGAWGLGSPEVRPGAIGAARLFGAVPVLVRVTDKQPGRAWTWRVGLGTVEMVHRVAPRPDGAGAEVAIDLLAPGPIEPVVAAAYGPVIAAMLGRLARVAEEEAAPAT